jgi:hypothetical protein
VQSVIQKRFYLGKPKGSPIEVEKLRDMRRRVLSFEIGDYVYLKVSPMRGI